MRTAIQLAATALLLIATRARAQITSPDILVAPAPRPPAARAKPAPIDDVQWMWHFAQPAPNGDEVGLLRDPRFARLLHDTFKAPQSFWRDGTVSLAEAASQHFGVTQGGVQGEDNRYISLTGCVAHSCPDQGLLWVDTLPNHVLLIFAATDWTAQSKGMEDPAADFNLWIFPSRALAQQALPEGFLRAALGWKHPGHIQTAVLVDPDGTPHPLNPITLQ